MRVQGKKIDLSGKHVQLTKVKRRASRGAGSEVEREEKNSHQMQQRRTEKTLKQE